MPLYFAVIDTESLKDPRLINRFSAFKVIIEYEPSSEANKYHHIFFIKVEFNKIKLISSQMKDGWFAFFGIKNILRDIKE